MAQTFPISTHDKHYIRFSVSPPTSDALSLRKAIADSLTEAFGATSTSTRVDILWIAEDGKEMVIRTHPEDAPKILASVVTSSERPRLSVLQESPFLPTLGSTVQL
ncbi:hypothetical protein FA15DRAFT_610895 [Coprinopsis marcescibilis]|uniref:Ribonucleases P/MRP subunit Pop8-like domain-containing protein n=1 Tax=Coprinopsis marcescibilis TaxID=230819 RepID=A0A5C3L8Y8_COPMA|nr:hypothetical protein FA15DRAFT_610895 [Coprinopsis marcescibilis]